MKRLLLFLLPVFVILGFSFISFLSLQKESLTYDEVVNIQEGKNAWIHHTFNIELYHPPLAKDLQALPIVVAENVFHLSPSPFLEKNLSQSMVILFADTLLLFVFVISKKFFSYPQALVATSALSLEPNFLAFSHIVNTDMAVVVMIFLCYTTWFILLQNSTLKNYFLFSFLLGLGFASKMSFDSFFVLSAIALLVVIKRKQTLAWMWEKKWYVVASCFIVLTIIWSTYFFHFSVVVKERNDANRFSARLLQYAKIHHNTLLVGLINFTEKQPIPLGDYLALYKNVALAKASPNCFFLGRYYPKCYWYFMPVTFLLKTSLPFLLLCVLGVYAFFYDKKKNKNFVYMSIPAVVMLLQAATSGAFPLNRYMLATYPFLAIIGSESIILLKKSIFWKVCIGILFVWGVSVVFHTFPHFLSFTNELAGPQNKAYLSFQDANIDWGQSLPDVANFHKQHPHTPILLSYFGRADGNLYGLSSDKPYGSFKANEICEFHSIGNTSLENTLTFVSISNWWECGYYKERQYQHPKGILSDSFLEF